MMVVAGFAAQPPMGRLHEQRRGFWALAYQSEHLAARRIGILALTIGKHGSVFRVPSIRAGRHELEYFGDSLLGVSRDRSSTEFHDALITQAVAREVAVRLVGSPGNSLQ